MDKGCHAAGWVGDWVAQEQPVKPRARCVHCDWGQSEAALKDLEIRCL